MNFFWFLLLVTFQVLVILKTSHAQDAQENGQKKEPTISCLELANPQTEDQIDEFRECIKSFNEERRSIRKLELIQKKFGASQMLTDQYNPSENRRPLKMVLGLIELKYMASEKLTKRIKNKPHNTGNTLPASSK